VAARVRPAWLPTLAALTFVVLTAYLGQWQWGKAELKTLRQARYADGERQAALGWQQAQALGEAALYRRVHLRGRFATGYQVLLDNRIHAGKAGYHVVTPLRLDAGRAVLVNRGWYQVAADRSVPKVPTPAGSVEVEGILVHAQGRYLELSGEADAGPLWQNLDLARYRAWYGSELPDWLVLQTSAATDGLLRDWPKPDLGIARNRSYAVQWFAMCAVIVGLWVYFVLWKRGRNG
jgi:surfeit locus 1 family protein